MLMIGVVGETPDESPLNITQPSLVAQRTHFGLWCVLSSPLTLSIDFSNATIVDLVWPIITNRLAIRVNQEWAGDHGTVFGACASVLFGVCGAQGGHPMPAGCRWWMLAESPP